MRKVKICSTDEKLKKTVCSLPDTVITEENADVMILDSACDAENLIHPLIIISDDGNAETECEYIIVRPYCESSIAFALDAVLPKSVSDEIEDGMRSGIKKTVMKMGMDAKRIGTEYATEAVMLYIKHHGNVKFNEIFGLIAEKFSTSRGAVERAIRTSIENMCQKGNITRIYEVFGNSIDPEKGKPSNAEFISTVAQRYYHVTSGKN